MKKHRSIGKITGTVDIKEAHNSTVIGVQVQYGPDRGQLREELRAAVGEGIKDLLLRHGHELKNLNSADPVAASLYACESKDRSALGFAVNNSGLIICPAVLGPIEKTRHLTSGRITSVEMLFAYSMLQAVRIRSSTHGLIPSYRYYPDLDEQLYAFNEAGGHCKLKVEGTHFAAKLGKGDARVRIHNAFLAHFDPPQNLIGGPVLNKFDEVMGIAVGSSDRFLIVQPWSKIENCIKMDWERSLTANTANNT